MREKISGIYCITNLVNGKKYIGLSVDCLRRWWDHRNKSLNSQKEDDFKKPLYKAMRKYGLDNFKFEIIEEVPSRDISKLKDREIYWIEYYHSYDTGYNATRGGDCPEGHAMCGEQHPMAKFTEAEVIQCRIWYKEGKRSRDIYDKYFAERISYSGFQNMWFGRSWKKVMPEVFDFNPHPRRKVLDEDILKIRELYYTGTTVSELDKIYKGIYAHATISDIINNKRYTEIQPDIPDNHRKLNRKLSDDNIRFIKAMKQEGKTNKEIRDLLEEQGCKVGITTVSDVAAGRRFANIN